MAQSLRELTAGSVELYQDQTLGAGSYGKVCRAKCGQLPCAAKLIHDTLFQHDPSGADNLTRRFELECQFLNTIKHPNIVQYLGTTRDPQYGRLVLLMELMDGSLTKFLEQQSTGPLSYHIQINICHDVALALSYLHSNAIVHRDLSSNNVLLIGEGNRAKVTDFGMSKLIDANPRMTPLTQCPGTSAYMPPEALSMPSQYSSKLDCFSYGVLTVQVVTRKFPNPGDASQYVEDPNYPTGRVLVQFPEKERRRADINLVYSQHPLRSIALHCLADREKERPSADELCARLASLKGRSRYTHSVKLSTDQSSASKQLIQEIESNRESFERELAEKEKLIRSNREELRQARDDLQKNQLETEKSRKELEMERETSKKNSQENQENQTVIQQIFEDYSKQLRELQWKLDCSEQNRLSEERKRIIVQQELAAIRSRSSNAAAAIFPNLDESRKQSAPINNPNQHPQPAASRSFQPPNTAVQPSNAAPQAMTSFQPHQSSCTPISITWKEGEKAPQIMRSIYGAAVEFHGKAYFSSFAERGNVFSYSPHDKKWTKLPDTKYMCFSLAVVNDQLTTIGGTTDLQYAEASTNVLLSYHVTAYVKKQWKECFPPMPTKRMCAASATTHNYLVVAGGEKGIETKLAEVEVMKTDTRQWFQANSLPQPLHYPQMAICGGCCYICAENTVFSCSIDTLIMTAQLIPTNNSAPLAWNKRADVPISAPGLATMKGQLISVGGKGRMDTPTTGALYRFDPLNNSWNFIGRMPTPRSHVLAVTLPSDTIVVVGGIYGATSITTEVGQLHCC